ncbi:MAG: hypothetical protein D6690_17740 [Nitrospirae bacterium]|nr:MAG: hypothetical protein D6690_17740 [Nitrospirota bacterium]
MMNSDDETIIQGRKKLVYTNTRMNPAIGADTTKVACFVISIAIQRSTRFRILPRQTLNYGGRNYE